MATQDSNMESEESNTTMQMLEDMLFRKQQDLAELVNEIDAANLELAGVQAVTILLEEKKLVISVLDEKRLQRVSESLKQIREKRENVEQFECSLDDNKDTEGMNFFLAQQRMAWEDNIRASGSLRRMTHLEAQVYAHRKSFLDSMKEKGVSHTLPFQTWFLSCFMYVDCVTKRVD